MAVEVRSFSPVIPAGTPVSAGWSADLSFPARVVDRIQVRVPPGPRGAVGFAIGSAGTSIIPYNPGEWIITDDESIDWPLEGQFDSGAWTLFAYNLGRQDHTIYIRFLLSLVTPTNPGITPTANLSVLGYTP